MVRTEQSITREEILVLISKGFYRQKEVMEILNYPYPYNYKFDEFLFNLGINFKEEVLKHKYSLIKKIDNMDFSYKDKFIAKTRLAKHLKIPPLISIEDKDVVIDIINTGCTTKVKLMEILSIHSQNELNDILYRLDIDIEEEVFTYYKNRISKKVISNYLEKPVTLNITKLASHFGIPVASFKKILELYNIDRYKRNRSLSQK